MTGKRQIALAGAIALVVVLVMGVAACAKPTPTPAPKASPAPAPAPVSGAKPGTAPSLDWLPPGAKLKSEIVAHVKEAGGTSFIVTQGFANIYNKFARGSKMSTEMIAGTAEKVAAMNAGKVDVSQGGIAHHVELYEGSVTPPLPKVRLRMFWIGDLKVITYQGYQTLANKGIKTFADLKGKKIGAENPGGPTWARISNGMLNANGMTRNDVKWVLFASANEAARDLLEGRLDAFVYNLGSGAQEIAQSPSGLYLIPISDKELKEIQKAEPTYYRATIPKGFMKIRNDGDVPYGGVTRCWTVMANIDDYSVYMMTKIMDEHPDEMKAVHPDMKSFVGAKAAMEQETFALPYHPGAIRYFKEKGVWGAQQTRLQKEALEREAKLYGDVPDMAKFRELGIQ